MAYADHLISENNLMAFHLDINNNAWDMSVWAGAAKILLRNFRH